MSKIIAYVRSVKFAKLALVILVIAALVVYGRHYYKENFIDVDTIPFSGVQNHLVWDVEGKCYFVKPIGLNSQRLIAIPDCAKENKDNKPLVPTYKKPVVVPAPIVVPVAPIKPTQ